MKSIALAILLAVPAAGLARPAAPSIYTDGTHGFRIQAPAFPKTKIGSVIPVMFLGPPNEGFSPNANVMVQYTNAGLEGYRELTLGQFKASGMTVHAVENRKVSGRDALFFDYSGRQGTRDLRWLALAVVEKDRVFLTTCTAPKDDFPALEKEFRACLGSFSVAD